MRFMDKKTYIRLCTTAVERYAIYNRMTPEEVAEKLSTRELVIKEADRNA